MSGEFILRPLRASDIDRVATLEGELFGRSAWSYAMISMELGAPGRWYVVAEYDSKVRAGGDKVMGYAGLWYDGDVAQVMTVGVSEQARRQGAGRLLMEALIKRAQQLGAHGLLLEVAVNNTAAITLYESFGFETISVRKRYYQPENVDAYVMRRDVSAPELALDAYESSPRDKVFITAPDLAQLKADGKEPKILDVRWQLGRSDGAEQYAQGHIPGAIYVDLETELASPSGELGRHPLPSSDQLSESIARWGITPESRIVIYDAVAGMSAARAWWLLRWAGFEDVRILDGGLASWADQGRQLEQAGNVPKMSAPSVQTGHMPTLTIDQAGTYPQEAYLIDARAKERFRGETEPIDPRAGHIPGALNIPTTTLVNPDGTLKSVSELTEIYAQAGVLEDTLALAHGEWPVPAQDVAVYCGSGVTACHQIAVLASLGIDSALFPGSWSQWSQDSTRPAVTGE